MLEPVPFRSPHSMATGRIGPLSFVDTWVRWFIQLRDEVNGWHPQSMADADAQPNTVYYSTDGSKLSYKDSGGSVHALY